MQKKLILCFFSLVLAGSVGFFFLYAQTASEPKVAPINPAFLEAIDNLRNGRSYQGPYGLGYIPSPVDLSHLKGVQDDVVRASYAASYDLRNYNKVTSVKYQGDCGSCWTFGAFGSLESSLLSGESRDFAEIDLARNHGFDIAECAGGNTHMAEAYLARWAGPYNETDYPYPYTISASVPSVQKHVQTVMWLPARTSPTDNDTIKWFLTNYGAITFGLYFYDYQEPYFNSAYNSYYFPSASNANHSICMIGWDDNFDKSKFTFTPAGNGAFLCKNSWGTSWGDGGYFWLSYYNPTISEMAVFVDAQSVANYKNIYQYDPLGLTNSYGFSTVTCWGANVFQASTSDPISAFGFITNDKCNVTYYIYKNPTAGNPTSGTLISSGIIGTYSYPGYYTYNLSSPATLALGDKFSIVIKYSNASYTYPLPVEGYTSGYSSAAANGAGQSFYSSDGSTWYDFVNYNNNSYRINCTIKAFTGGMPAISALTPSPSLPQAAGTPITWTATASGGIAPLEYKFFLYNGVVWAMVQDFGTANTWIWTPTQAGQYAVQVWVRSAGSTANYDAYKGSGYFNITGSTLAVNSLTPTPAPPQSVGTPITWTATATGGIAPLQYKFWVYGASSGWMMGQDFSTSNTWNWTPTQPGQYAVQVWVRNSSSTATYDAWKGSGYFDITGTTLSITSLTPLPALPQGVGTPIIWTAMVQGGIAPLQYKYWVYSAASGWTMIRDFDTSNVCTWTPTQPGQYALQVWVRNAGSTATYDAWKGSGYFDITGNTLSITSLTPSPAPPQGVGTPITWTATATGGIAPLQYRFYLYSSSTGWVVAQDYSSSNTWTWTSTQPGQYAVQVWVRNAGSTASYDAWKGSGYFDITGISLSVTSLTPSPGVPQSVGTPINWTATATGGIAPLQYKFYLYNASTGWLVAQDYSSSNTWTWTPAQAGQYAIQVWVRNAGSTANYDAWRGSGYFDITASPESLMIFRY